MVTMTWPIFSDIHKRQILLFWAWRHNKINMGRFLFNFHVLYLSFYHQRVIPLWLSMPVFNNRFLRTNIFLQYISTHSLHIFVIRTHSITKDVACLIIKALREVKQITINSCQIPSVITNKKLFTKYISTYD